MSKPEDHPPDPTVVREYFQEQLKYDHDDHTPPPNTLAVHQNQHRLIIDAVRRDSESRKIYFLDIGCGWGDFSNKLDPYLTNYIGVEPSVSELRQFRQRPARHVINGVGENLSYLRDNSRNVILLNSVLDHCVDWRRTFNNCLRVLAPGGLMIISMENEEKLPVKLKKLLHLNAQHEGHLAFFTYQGVRELLEQENFAIEKRCTIGFLYGFHHVTKILPIPVGIMRPINRCVDAVAKVLYPHGGHVLFFAGRNQRKSSAPLNFENPFQCPKCHGPWTFGEKNCTACGMQMDYNENGALNALAFTDTEQIIAAKAGSQS